MTRTRWALSRNGSADTGGKPRQRGVAEAPQVNQSLAQQLQRVEAKLPVPLPLFQHRVLVPVGEQIFR